MALDADELLANLRRAEFILRLIATGDQEALSYARSVSRDLRQVIEKNGAQVVPGPNLGAAKKSKKAEPPPRERREPTYWDSVESIAQEIKESCPHPDRDNECRVERVHEDVDGSSWIIYYNENETVLRETHNEPDPREVKGMSAPDADWKQMRTTAAYLAMEGDVWEALRELDEKELEG